MTGFQRLLNKHARSNRLDTHLDVQVRRVFEELRDRDITMQQELHDANVQYEFELDRMQQRVNFANEHIESENELAVTEASASTQEMIEELLINIAKQQQDIDIPIDHRVHKVVDQMFNSILAKDMEEPRWSTAGNLEMIRSALRELSIACPFEPGKTRGMHMAPRDPDSEAFEALPPNIRQKLLEEARQTFTTEHQSTLEQDTELEHDIEMVKQVCFRLNHSKHHAEMHSQFEKAMQLSAARRNTPYHVEKEHCIQMIMQLSAKHNSETHHAEMMHYVESALERSARKRDAAQALFGLGGLSARDREALLAEAERVVEARSHTAAVSAVDRQKLFEEARQTVETEHQAEERRLWDKYKALSAHDEAISTRCDKLRSELQEAVVTTEVHDREHEAQLEEVVQHDNEELEEAKQHWEEDHVLEMQRWREKMKAEENQWRERLESLAAHDKSLDVKCEELRQKMEALAEHDESLGSAVDELKAELHEAEVHERETIRAELEEAEIHEREHVAQMAEEVHQKDLEELQEARQHWETDHHSAEKEWRKKLLKLGAHDATMGLKVDKLSTQLKETQHEAHEAVESDRQHTADALKTASNQENQIALLKKDVGTLRELYGEENKLRVSLAESKAILEERSASAEQALLQERELAKEATMRAEQAEQSHQRVQLQLQMETDARISWKQKASSLKDELGGVKQALTKINDMKAKVASSLETESKRAKKHMQKDKDDIEFLIQEMHEKNDLFEQEKQGRQALQEQVNVLNESLKKQSLLRQSAEKEKEDVQRKLDDCNRQMKLLRAKISEEDEEIDHLRDECEKLAAAKKEEEIAHQKDLNLLHDMEIQCSQLQQHLKAIEGFKKAAETRSEKKIQSTEKAKAKAEALAAKVEEYEEQIAELEAAVKEYQDALESEEKLLERTTKERDKLRLANAALEEDVKRKVKAEAEVEEKKKFKARESVVSDQSARINKLEKDLEISRQEFARLESKYAAEVESRKRAEEREQEGTQVSEKNMKDAKKAAKKWKEEKQVLMLEQATQAETIEQQRKQIKRLNKEVNHLAEELDLLDSEHAKGQETGRAHSSRISTLEDEFKQETKLRSEAQVARQIAEDRARVVELAKQEAESRCLEMEKVVNDHRNAGELLKEQLVQLRRVQEEEKQDQKQAKEEAASNAKSLKVAKQALQELTDLQHSLEDAHSDLTKERDDLEQQVQTYSAEIGQFKAHIQELDRHIDELESDIQKEQKRRKRAEMELKGANQTLHRTTQSADHMDKARQELEKAAWEKTQVEEEAKAERDALDEEVSEQRARIRELENEMLQCQVQLEETKRLWSGAHEINLNLEKKLASKEQELIEMESAHHELEEAHEQLKTEFVAEHKKQVQHQFKTDEFESKIADLNSQISGLQGLVDSAEQRIAKAEAGRKAAELRFKAEEQNRQNAENWRAADTNFEILKLEREVRRLKHVRKEEAFDRAE